MDNQLASGNPFFDDLRGKPEVNVTESSSVGELLECHVCLNVMYPPIHQCLNGHTLCFNCKPRVRNRCPTCRHELGNIRCLALEKMAASLELPCKYQSFGCMGKYSYYSKLKHESECVYRLYNCTYAGSECTVIGDIPFQVDNQPGQDESEDVWSRPNWPPRLEKILVELMIEEMKYHVDMYAGNFKEESWDRVCKEFNAETGLNYEKTELKKHLAVLRKRYHIVKPPYNHGGFGWDYHRKMVDVDDLVWQEYIEAYPKIKPYRKYGCPIYEELCTIFTKPIATGEYTIAVGGGSMWCSWGNVNNMNGRNKRQITEPMSSGSNKRNCKGAASSKASATPEANSVSKLKGTAMAQAEDPLSAGRCISIINGMQGVDRCLYNAAVDLFQNQSWRKTFMSLKSEKRLIWLKAMLSNVP